MTAPLPVIAADLVEVYRAGYASAFPRTDTAPISADEAGVRAGLAAVVPLIAAQVLAGHRAPNGCEECAACVRQDRTEERAAVLAELATAGRLLPEGGETRQEWGIEASGGGVIDPWHTEEACRHAVDRVGGRPIIRTVTTWPDGTTLTTPWQPVDTEGEHRG